MAHDNISGEPTPSVTVENLHISYGKNRGVRGVSFELFPGEVVGILGGNGAGKSSTMRALAGANPPTSGNITVSGYHLTDMLTANKARMLTGYCPDVGGLIPSATPMEHINIALSVHNKKHLAPAVPALLARFGMTDKANQPTRGFSHGQKRRLSVILAALSAETLLILDEPFDGVDPSGVEETLSLIGEAKAAGLTVVLSTHLQDIITKASDRIIVVNNGVIVDKGDVRLFQGEAGVERYRASIKKEGVAE